MNCLDRKMPWNKSLSYLQDSSLGCHVNVASRKSLEIQAHSITKPRTLPKRPNISFVPWSQKRSATTFDPFAQLFQHCSGHARVLRMVCKVLWVVSVPRCNAGPSIVRSCCTRLQTTANTDATTPSIIGPTLFGFLISSAARLRRPLS